MVFQLIYASSAAGLYNANAFRNIAQGAADANVELDITGLLLLYNESIFQVLEGPSDNVLSLYDRISRDPRHKNSIVLSQGHIAARQFAGWAMGFEEVTDPQEPDFIFQLRNRVLDDKLPEKICAKTTALITSFRRSSGLEINI